MKMVINIFYPKTCTQTKKLSWTLHNVSIILTVFSYKYISELLSKKVMHLNESIIIIQFQ